MNESSLYSPADSVLNITQIKYESVWNFSVRNIFMYLGPEHRLAWGSIVYAKKKKKKNPPSFYCSSPKLMFRPFEGLNMLKSSLKIACAGLVKHFAIYELCEEIAL